jgi:hypothetical protein
MFTVLFTQEAKDVIAEQLARENFAKPGLMIHRQGPRGDLTRTSTGQAQWNVERPHPWRAYIGDLQLLGDNPEGVFTFDGVLVYFALIPKQGEAGVEVSVRDGELFVDAIRV